MAAPPDSTASIPRRSLAAFASSDGDWPPPAVLVTYRFVLDSLSRSATSRQEIGMKMG